MDSQNSIRIGSVNTLGIQIIHLRRKTDLVLSYSGKDTGGEKNKVQESKK